jgi:hypothetical protein
MEFENQGAEEVYKSIVSSDGIGFYEIVSRPKDYQNAITENTELRPEDLDRTDQALRAFEILEEAGFLSSNGDFRGYEVEDSYGEDTVEEVFTKIEEKRQHLV